MRTRRVLAYVWASPATALGLVIGTLGCLTRGGKHAAVDGVLEFHGGLVTRILESLPVPGGCLALTLGHVVLGCHADCLTESRAHERVHVAQYERWGPIFLLAYAASSGLAALKGRDPYLDNRFEREAYRLAPDS